MSRKRRMTWDWMQFEDAEELAREARSYTSKPVTAEVVREIVGYQPIYDGHDLQEMLEALGWRARPKKSYRRLIELAERAKTELPAPVSIDGFVARLMPDLDKGQQAEAADIILRRRVGEMDWWPKIFSKLSARFPQWCPTATDWDTLDDEFGAACRPRNDEGDGDSCWRVARKIASQVVNRGRRKNRLGRQSYLEDLVFNYLWYGILITEDDLTYRLETITAEAREGRVVLYKALEKLPPPRSVEQLIAAAHRLLGGSGSRHDRDYQRFRRLIYRNTLPSERGALRTMDWEPLEVLTSDGWKPISIDDFEKLASLRERGAQDDGPGASPGPH